MSLAKFGRHFTGVALELTPTSDFRPIEARTRTRLKDLWSRLTNYRGALVQILSLSLLLQLTALIAPLYLQLVVDEAIGQGNTRPAAHPADRLRRRLRSGGDHARVARMGGADARRIADLPAGRQCRPPSRPPAARLFRAAPRRRSAVADRFDQADPVAAYPGPRQRPDRFRAAAHDLVRDGDDQPAADSPRRSVSPSFIWPSACSSIRACGGAPRRRSSRAPTRKPI